jgi:predicted DNA-binding protein (MmcQ/YjbR family)
MDLEAFRTYCLSKAGVTEGFPFDNETLVFKVSGKIFALTNISTFDAVNLKCDPEKAIELRETYSAVTPGYHMNKKHWNTIEFDGSVGFRLLKEWIDHSYDLVLNSLPRKERERLRHTE